MEEIKQKKIDTNNSILNSTAHGAVGDSGRPCISPIKHEEEKTENSDEEEEIDKEPQEEVTVSDATMIETCIQLDVNMAQMQRTLSDIDNNNQNMDSKLSSRDRLIGQSLKGIVESIAELSTEVGTIKSNQQKLFQRLSCSPKSAAGCTCKTELTSINETVHDLKGSVQRLTETITNMTENGDNNAATPDIKSDIEAIMSALQGLASLQAISHAPTKQKDEQPNNQIFAQAECDSGSVPSQSANQNIHQANVIQPQTVPVITHNDARPKKQRDDTNIVHPDTQIIVFSDSMSRDINGCDIDASNRTQVKTYGGANAIELERKIASFQRNTKIAKVMIQTPMKDSVARTPDMAKNLESLVQTTKYKFPNSQIYASAVLPGKCGLDAKTVRYNAEVCSPVYKDNGVKFYNFGPQFKDASLYETNGDVHLNSGEGSTKLLRCFQEVLIKGQGDQFLFDKVSQQKEPNSNSFNDTAPVRTERKGYIRNNYFQGFGCPITNRGDPYTLKAELIDLPMISSAKSVMMAYRLQQDNGEVLESYDDDNEVGGGKCILREMQRLDMMNCAVFVPRWLRDHRDHIFDLRWEIIADVTAEVAMLLSYRVPPRNHPASPYERKLFWGSGRGQGGQNFSHAHRSWRGHRGRGARGHGRGYGGGQRSRGSRGGRGSRGPRHYRYNDQTGYSNSREYSSQYTQSQQQLDEDKHLEPVQQRLLDISKSNIPPPPAYTSTEPQTQTSAIAQTQTSASASNQTSATPTASTTLPAHNAWLQSSATQAPQFMQPQQNARVPIPAPNMYVPSILNPNYGNLLNSLLAGSSGRPHWYFSY